MKNTQPRLHIWLLLLSLGAPACGDDDGDRDTSSDATAPQCDDPDGYVAFDMTNHESQDQRLSAYAEMLELMSAAVDEDGGVDADKMAEAADIYLDDNASANLREKVMGRVDQHDEDEPAVGEELDASLLAWLDFAKQADTALAARVARQWLDKTLLDFFFLSVHHELLEGTRETWDEAYGYYGSGPHNEEGERLGLSATATDRDDENGTNLSAEIFNALIDGACELDMALTDADTDQLDLADAEALSAIVQDIDGSLQKVLAYSVGHEAYEVAGLIEAGADDLDELTVEAAELLAFARPLVRVMRSRGGDSKERAEELQQLLDVVPLSDPETLDLEDTGWIEEVDTDRIIELLEAEYDIEVLG